MHHSDDVIRVLTIERLHAGKQGRPHTELVDNVAEVSHKEGVLLVAQQSDGVSTQSSLHATPDHTQVSHERLY